MSFGIKKEIFFYYFKELKMELICRTIYGSYIQTCALLGKPVILAPNSTLNEKLGIQSNVAFSADQLPTMRYAAIGNGGHKMVMGSNGISRPEPIQHRSTDAALYNQLPFVLRLPSNDLTASQREKYGHRRLEMHDGTQYVAYYLKRLNYDDVSTQMTYQSVVDGVTTSSPFVPNNSNLNPTPPDLASTGVNVTTGDYVSAVSNIPFTLNVDEVNEIINVANIIYGDVGYAIISEIALCAGVEKVVSAVGVGGTTFNYSEVIGTQVVSFVNSFFAMNFSNNGLNVMFGVGATEPLNLLTSAP